MSVDEHRQAKRLEPDKSSSTSGDKLVILDFLRLYNCQPIFCPGTSNIPTVDFGLFRSVIAFRTEPDDVMIFETLESVDG